VFENRVLSRIFGTKRVEVTGGCTHHKIIIRQIKSRKMRWEGHVARMREERKVYKVLVGKPEGKRPLGRTRRRWEDGFRTDLSDMGGVDSTGSAQGPVVGCCECGDKPSGSSATEFLRSLHQSLICMKRCQN
jgi:hypothetical protein